MFFFLNFCTTLKYFMKHTFSSVTHLGLSRCGIFLVFFVVVDIIIRFICGNWNYRFYHVTEIQLCCTIASSLIFHVTDRGKRMLKHCYCHEYTWRSFSRVYSVAIQTHRQQNYVSFRETRAWLLCYPNLTAISRRGRYFARFICELRTGILFFSISR